MTSLTPDLSDQVADFIDQYVPITEALKILMTLCDHPGRQWKPKELADESRQGLVLVDDYVTFLESNKLVVLENSTIRLAPATPTLNHALKALAQAYNERPVSVIRAIYMPRAGSKAQAFADAFKIRKD